MGGAGESLIAVAAGSLCCTAFHKCNLAFDSYGGILLWIAIMLYMFKALGTICDEYFVPSLEVIVEKLQLSNDVAGATFMAAGSSAPELFTSLVATFLIVNEGGVGTIVGSAIFNILVIVGATGYIACKDQSLKIWWYPLSRDCFFYIVSIAELMVILSNESVEWYEGVIMFFTYCLYCLYMKFNPKIVEMLGIQDPSELQESVVTVVDPSSSEIKVMEVMQTAPLKESLKDGGANGSTQPEGSALRSLAAGEAKDETKQPAAEASVEATQAPGTVNTDETSLKEESLDERDLKDSTTLTVKPPESLDPPKASPREQRRPSWSYAETNGAAKNNAGEAKKEGAEEDGKPAPLCEAEPEEAKGWLRDPINVFWELTMPGPERMNGLALFSMSILFIGICTYVMVDAVNRTGEILHIPPLAMALVFLAAGTSIPDALGSIAVAKQGEGDMAVSNALGSNIFDILIGLGVPWTIKTGILQKEVTFPGKWDELIYDIFVLVFVLLLFIGCLLAHRWYLTRTVGILLLCFYGGFLFYNILAIWVIDPPLKSQEEEAYCDTL